MGMFLRRGLPTPEHFTVDISGDFSSTNAYATIGETKYTAAATVEVKPDATVDVYVGGFEKQNRISLNGDLVLAGAGTYALKVTGNAVIAFDKKSNSSGSWYICDITMG
jgi:hypothetical protein